MFFNSILLLNPESTKTAGRIPSLFFFSSILCYLLCLLGATQGVERDSMLKSEAQISCVRPLMKSLLLTISLNWGQCKLVLSSECIQTLSGRSAFPIRQLFNPAQYCGAIHNCGDIPVEEKPSFYFFSYTGIFSVISSDNPALDFLFLVLHSFLLVYSNH